MFRSTVGYAIRGKCLCPIVTHWRQIVLILRNIGSLGGAWWRARCGSEATVDLRALDVRDLLNVGFRRRVCPVPAWRSDNLSAK
jgi:hypothetical protein